MKMRKTENKGQAACNDDNVEMEKSPATETPAPKLATPNEEQCEPGRRRSRAQEAQAGQVSFDGALERVMSERLDEQGFEKFFADRLPRWWCSRVYGSSRSGRCCPAGLRCDQVERIARARRMKKAKSKPMVGRRKLRGDRRIKPMIPLLAAKNEAKCQKKIIVASDGNTNRARMMQEHRKSNRHNPFTEGFRKYRSGRQIANFFNGPIVS